MKISIAMATYNGERFLGEQLDSLAAQTRLPDELVVTDDGSSDGTTAILEDFALRAPFTVRIERNPANLGYARNFEKAARLCSGDIVFFCDQDDVWLPEKVARVTEEFERNPGTVVVLNDADLVHGDLTPFGKTQLQSLLKSGFQRPDFIVGSFSAHRKSWQEVAFPVPDGLAHDSWTNGLAHQCGLSSLIERPLQVYRRHGDNVSQWAFSNPGGSNLESIREHGLKDSSAGWDRMARMLELMQQRISASPHLLPSDALDHALVRLAQRLEAIEERARFCELKRPARFPRIVRFWVRGGYRHSRGVLSAAKDLFRP